MKIENSSRPLRLDWEKIGTRWIARVGKLSLVVKESGSVSCGYRWRVDEIFGMGLVMSSSDVLEETLHAAEKAAFTFGLDALEKLKAMAPSEPAKEDAASGASTVMIFEAAGAYFTGTPKMSGRIRCWYLDDELVSQNPPIPVQQDVAIKVVVPSHVQTVVAVVIDDKIRNYPLAFNREQPAR